MKLHALNQPAGSHYACSFIGLDVAALIPHFDAGISPFVWWLKFGPKDVSFDSVAKKLNVHWAPFTGAERDE